MANVVQIGLVLLLTTVDAKMSIKVADDRLTSTIHKMDFMTRLKRSPNELTTSSLSSNLNGVDNDNRWNHLSSMDLIDEDKRGGAQKFFGMRGKKSYDEEIDEVKRNRPPRPAESFFGMRGKKLSSNGGGDQRTPRRDVFYGMRGRRNFQPNEANKRQIPTAFYGMRGKKGASNDDEQQQEIDEISPLEEQFDGENKRDAPNRFLGMRGKKSEQVTSGPEQYMIRSGVDDVVYPQVVSPVDEIKARRQVALLFRNLQAQKQSNYADRKRQAGNLFIGMRG
ncbi:hypothetical protein CHUAL_009953 [Chamberlinius hualienensis]